MARHVITRAGLAKLNEELQALKQKKRPAVIARIKSARELGDLAENADYQDAREEQAFIEGRIQELEAMIKDAEVVESGGVNGRVKLGSVVKVEANGGTVEFTLVGPNESDPASGAISCQSPIGSALIDKGVGERVDVRTPGGVATYKIIKVD